MTYKAVMFLLILISGISAQPTVRSLQINGGSGIPVLTRVSDGYSGRINISFDVESEQIPNMDIIFRFCDKNWKPYSALEFQNRLNNIDRNLAFESLPAGVAGADYYFNGYYPSSEVTFPFSGHYIFEIVNTYNHNEVYEYGKFFVVDQIVELSVEIMDERFDDRNSFPFKLDEVHKITTAFSLPDGYFNNQIEEVRIYQNKVLEEPYVIRRDDYGRNRYFEWDGANRMKFIAKDVIPGNEYRQIDIRKASKYPAPDAKAHFGGFDQSRFYSRAKRDNNGGFTLISPKNAEGDYLNVKFELQLPKPIDEDIFLTGSFNFWELWPIYKMEKKDDFYSIEIPLKRGVYDYQYVTGYLRDDEIINPDRVAIEGNFWETNNEYSVFLYYRTTELGGYDKIIGFERKTNN
ncbi:MAG: hypothetical protein SCALA702_05510 [Melioribacteraceae bacterium]|nr:MAG: hypothetical protein SCALA702_05510 [Melioribacteraceae bacterium]